MVSTAFGNIVKECVLWYITLVDNAIIHIHSPAIHFIVKSEIVRDNNQSYFCISDNFTEIFPFGNSFLQSNGYKPTPLDLSTVQMSEVLEDLVDMLAENTHNVWAKDRIKNGWTYGLFEVCN